MAKQVKKLLSAVAANTTGTVTPIGLPCGIAITTTGTVSMTVTINGGNDGTNMGVLATFAITTATTSIYHDTFGWPYISADVSSWTNGTVTVTASY